MNSMFSVNLCVTRNLDISFSAQNTCGAHQESGKGILCSSHSLHLYRAVNLVSSTLSLTQLIWIINPHGAEITKNTTYRFIGLEMHSIRYKFLLKRSVALVGYGSIAREAKGLIILVSPN